MEKTKLNKFISKYFLSGLADSVVWRKKENLSVKFVDDTKSLIGEVIYENAPFPECEFGINKTSKFRNVINVLGDELNIEVEKENDIAYKLNISDSNVDVNYMLAEIDVIPKAPNVKNLPSWNLTLSADEVFIDTFIKASNALPETKEFAVNTADDKVAFVIGQGQATKIAVNIEPKTYNDIDAMYFSTAHLKEIFVANKEAKGGKIDVSDKGLMRVIFNVDELKAIYFLVSKQDISN